MIIQLNADKSLTIHSEYEAQITAQLTKDLDRFTGHITRVEVHLSDENGNKSGINDKKCLLEARFEGKPPIVTSDLGNTYDLALKGATEKLKHALTTIVSKLKEKV
ncbi:HPF/RaiA family ribosome-associated protein [Pedobacter frigiditerrae]|uniref:HPF/RaiA family ribosome-associated protein n=1 Tax=Pedobacter frigiditerrae TaxID=2530452 RepID=A0A4R0MWM7_9SPHI|nr:HPF/RaiA family ribosome-associated protein [Pedobacter frigiditerrae]TCC90344.1 HPF/RaiA family ribosome-associated protein [Pedobacter frigiditerrae]